MSPIRPVLIVEDDAAIREVMAEALGDEGYLTLTAEHGAAALACLEQTRPCLILLDLIMPVLDGFAFRAVQAGSGRGGIKLHRIEAVGHRRAVRGGDPELVLGRAGPERQEEHRRRGGRLRWRRRAGYDGRQERRDEQQPACEPPQRGHGWHTPRPFNTAHANAGGRNGPQPRSAEEQRDHVHLR
jgi:hypothetical protein